MRKQQFLEELRRRLSALPQKDVEEQLAFYGEMIDDRMEEGMSEEEAVCDIGTVEDIASQIVAETPLSTLVKEKVKPKRALRAWEIVLLILGSPVWLSLLIAAVAVLFSVYVVLWSLIISLWAVGASVGGSSLGAVFASGLVAMRGDLPLGLAMLGAGLVCAGLSILLFFGCKGATKGILILTKKVTLGIKNVFVKGGREA